MTTSMPIYARASQQITSAGKPSGSPAVRRTARRVRLSRLFLLILFLPIGRLHAQAAPGAKERFAHVVPTPQQPTPQPIYKKWWFWSAVGAVAAGAVVTGTVLGLQQSNQGYPPGDVDPGNQRMLTFSLRSSR